MIAVLTSDVSHYCCYTLHAGMQGDVRSRFNQNSATSGPLPPEVSTKRKADTDASLDEPLPFKKMKSGKD